MRFISSIPALPARDVAGSARFYAETLGFQVVLSQADFAIVKRDDVELHLWQAADEGWRKRDPQKPVQSGAESFIAGTASCRVRVSGIDELHRDLQPRGVLHKNGPLTDTEWGTREFAVVDPDNNLITFFERR